MKIIRNLGEITNKGSVGIGLTIGNFDGVHVGHQVLFKKINEECLASGLKFVVITFTPHPIEILTGADNFLINTYWERRELLENMGVDYLCEIDFTRDFSTKSPEEFVEEHILSSKLLKKIYLGYDFAFGTNKCGTFDIMKKICTSSNISVELMDKYQLDSESISSSVVRNYLSQANLDKVTKFLGRNFFLTGTVVKGAGRGKKIGHPTANIMTCGRRLIPPGGVYVTKTYHKNVTYQSITNIGFNPTFIKNAKQSTIEVHIFDFDQEIYGEELKVDFIKRLRDEKKFHSANELIIQIRKDIMSARNFFAYN